MNIIPENQGVRTDGENQGVVTNKSNEVGANMGNLKE